MNRLSPVLLVAALLGLTGCATKYVVVSQLPRSELEVVVFTDDRDQGAELLDALSDLGYDNEQNHVALPSDDADAGIRWGAATEAQVDEIAAFIRGRHGIDLDRDRAFKPSDKSVFITLPETGTAAEAGPVERADLRIVVFTDDEERGNSLLESLESLGYTNDENYVTDEPNDDFNIKWGAAHGEMIDEIVGAASAGLSVELDRQGSFEPDDRDVFINLPFGAAAREPSRADYEITVFCDDTKQGRRLLRKLKTLGYENEGNEVIAGPNDDFNIKYGDLPDAMLEELAGLLEKEYGTGFRRSDEFDKTSRQVFINLPVRRE